MSRRYDVSSQPRPGGRPRAGRAPRSRARRGGRRRPTRTRARPAVTSPCASPGRPASVAGRGVCWWGFAREVDLADVAEHARLVRAARRSAQISLQRVLGRRDEMPRSGPRGSARADPPPERRAAATSVRHWHAKPAASRGWPQPSVTIPSGIDEERERRVAAVADEMDVARGRGRDARAAAGTACTSASCRPSAPCPAARRTRDRRPRSPRPAVIPGRSRAATSSGGEPPLAERRQPAQVVDERRRRRSEPRCRSASWGMKYDSSGTAIARLRSSITRSSVVPERRTPRTKSGGSLIVPP